MATVELRVDITSTSTNTVAVGKVVKTVTYQTITDMVDETVVADYVSYMTPKLTP